MAAVGQFIRMFREEGLVPRRYGDNAGAGKPMVAAFHGQVGDPALQRRGGSISSSDCQPKRGDPGNGGA
jgi:hypothetical protein